MKEENIKDQNGISAYRQQRKQIHEDLQLQKNEYRGAKEDFLKVKNQIRQESLILALKKL